MDKSDTRCKFICSKGRCKRTSVTTGTLCWQHSPSLLGTVTPSLLGTVPFLLKQKRESLIDYRGISLNDNYTNLEWKEEMTLEDYSNKFITVMEKLKDLGSLLKGEWKVSLHRHYPGIQFTNKEADDTEDKYFYKSGTESKTFRNKYYYFKNPKYILDEESTLDYLSEKSKVWDEEISYFDQSSFKLVQVKAKDIKDKLQKQTLKLLSGIYKIHLQPKPEYQIYIVKKFISLINENKSLRSCIGDFKVVIPYHRTLDNNKIPAIVIYPVYGKKESKKVLTEIVKEFGKLDDKKLGLGILPRFNHKFNNLIYWAEYHGGSKKYFLEKYPEEMDNIFVPPDYAHFKCKENKCHINP